MEVLSHACFSYLEKKKLPDMSYKILYNTSHHVKTITLCLYLVQELHNDEVCLTG